MIQEVDPELTSARPSHTSFNQSTVAIGPGARATSNSISLTIPVLGLVDKPEAFCNIPGRERFVEPPSYNDLCHKIELKGFVVIAGISGSGKTFLCYYYANEKKSTYPIRRILNAKNEASLLKDLIQLYRMCAGDELAEKLLKNDKTDSEKVDIILSCINSRLEELAGTGKKVLLIFDNAPRERNGIYSQVLKGLNPEYHLLLTTQDDCYLTAPDQTKLNAVMLNLNKGWDKESAVRFFDKEKLFSLPDIITVEQKQELDELVEYILFPLGLEIAARTVDRQRQILGEYSYSQYLKEIKEGAAEDLEKEVADNKERIQERVIRKAVELITDKNMRLFLSLAAHIAHDEISAEFCELYYQKLNPVSKNAVDSPESKRQVHSYLEELGRYSLISRQSPRVYYTHECIQNVILRTLSEDEHNIGAIYASFQHYLYDDVDKLFGLLPQAVLDNVVHHYIYFCRHIIKKLQGYELTTKTFATEFRNFNTILSSAIVINLNTPRKIIKDIKEIVDQVLLIVEPVIKETSTIHISQAKGLEFILTSTIKLLNQNEIDTVKYSEALDQYFNRYYWFLGDLIIKNLPIIYKFLAIENNSQCSIFEQLSCTNINAKALGHIERWYLFLSVSVQELVIDNVPVPVDSSYQAIKFKRNYVNYLLVIANVFASLNAFERQQQLLNEIITIINEIGGKDLLRIKVFIQLAKSHMKNRQLEAALANIDLAFSLVSELSISAASEFEIEILKLYLEYFYATGNRKKTLEYSELLETAIVVQEPLLHSKSLILAGLMRDYSDLGERKKFKAILTTCRNIMVSSPTHFLSIYFNLIELDALNDESKSEESFQNYWQFLEKLEGINISSTYRINFLASSLPMALQARKKDVLQYLVRKIMPYLNIIHMNYTLIFSVKIAQIILAIISQKIDEAKKQYVALRDDLSTQQPINHREALNYYMLARIANYLSEPEHAKNLLEKGKSYLERILLPDNPNLTEIVEFATKLDSGQVIDDYFDWRDSVEPVYHVSAGETEANISACAGCGVQSIFYAGRSAARSSGPSAAGASAT